MDDNSFANSFTQLTSKIRSDINDVLKTWLVANREHWPLEKGNHSTENKNRTEIYSSIGSVQISD